LTEVRGLKNESAPERWAPGRSRTLDGRSVVVWSARQPQRAAQQVALQSPRLP